MKESDIPPIKGNPRIGKETEQDASVMYGGAQLPTKKRRRSPAKPTRRKHEQRAIAIKDEAELERLMKVLHLDCTSVVNLGLAALAKQWL